MARRNRRKAKRFQLDYPFCQMSPTMEGFCVVKDLSLTGAQILNRHPPPIGSEVKLWFDRGKLNGFRTMGRVVRHNTHGDLGFGLVFIGPNMRLLLAAVGKGG
jgi:hypothetical protein